MLITIPALVPLTLVFAHTVPFRIYVITVPYFQKLGVQPLWPYFCLSRSQGRVCTDTALRTLGVGFSFSRSSWYNQFWRHSKLS